MLSWCSPRAIAQPSKWWSALEDIGLSAWGPSSQPRMHYQQLTNWNGACPAHFEVYSLLHTCQMHLPLAEGQSCKQAASLPSLITFGSKVSQQRDPGIHARAPWQTHTHTVVQCTKQKWHRPHLKPECVTFTGNQLSWNETENTYVYFQFHKVTKNKELLCVIC